MYFMQHATQKTYMLTYWTVFMLWNITPCYVVILKTAAGYFLRQIDGTKNPKLISWVDHYKLHGISSNYRHYEISGSK